jgi:hypothetical protein
MPDLCYHPQSLPCNIATVIGTNNFQCPDQTTNLVGPFNSETLVHFIRPGCKSSSKP